MRHKTIEEYIETIFVLEQRNGRAQTGMIAAHMGVKPPSITEMLQNLEREGLINYESYNGATLTLSGKKNCTGADAETPYYRGFTGNHRD